MKKEWVSPKLEILEIVETACGSDNVENPDGQWTTYIGKARYDIIGYNS